jgi:ATP-dependent protease ClpP protease subunit
MEGIIYIEGVIGEDYTYQNALMDLERVKDLENIALKIGSEGGYVDVADKIFDLFKGKVSRTENIGDVASAAVKLFLLAPKGFRNYDPSKGVFLIHNPWGEVKGDSNDFKQASEQLKKIESEFVNFYHQSTGSSKEVIAGFMNINNPLTPEEVESLGFAQISKPEFKAVAKFTKKNNMSKEQMTEEQIDNKLNSFFDRIKNLINPKTVKALKLSDANGVEIDFGDSVEQESEIVVGLEGVTIDGAAANGEYVMPDGRTITFENGTITAITEMEEEPEMDEEMEALKAELEALKAENETLTQAKAKFEKLEEEVKEFKSNWKAQKGEPAKEAEPVARVGYKKNK